MKQDYMTPIIEIVEIEVESALLSTSVESNQSWNGATPSWENSTTEGGWK